jgi:hypothetical protein
MREPYHCPFCDQRSTRRWNLEVHIKRKHGGTPDPDLASHPFSYKPAYTYHNIESTKVSDNGWNSFRPGYGLQQAPVGISQYSSDTIYPPWQIIDDQSYGNSFSETTTTKLKIEELKRLVYKYPQYHNNDPDVIIQWAIHSSLNGDNTFLNDKLEQLRSIDSLSRH